MNSNCGFSLVELMVSVSIVGILTSLGAVNFGKFAGRAKYGRAKAEMSQMSSIIQGLRISEDKFLMEITGTHCTYCTDSALATWPMLGYDTPPVDPWGSMYILDENEGGVVDCRSDWIFTAGADRQFAGLIIPAQGDDAQVSVPWVNPHPNCPGPEAPFTIGPDFAY